MPRARARALDLSVFVQYPEQFLPVAFFSELPPELYPAAVKMVRLVRAGDGDVVFREGDPGSAFYFVAAGEVRVVAGGKPLDGRPTRAVELTRLLEGALFGEMALMTDQARTASIQVVGEADLLEVSRAAVAELTRAVPVLAERLDRFARERLLEEPHRDVAAVQAVRQPAADGAHPPVRGDRHGGRHDRHPRERGRPGPVRHPAGRGRGVEAR